jgi:large subunit ribosomal protein L25
MTAVKEIKATLRPKAGKGAARAVRREGRTPAVIYGANEAPLAIAVDHADIRTKIYAGHFLTTLYDVEIDGKKHRVIPRDYQLDPVKDFPIHVDFMRLSEGALIRVNVPVHVINTEQSPGVKRGGAVNIVTHSIPLRCPPDRIPQSIEVDVAGLEINNSKHLSDVTLPEGVKPIAREDMTLVTIVPPSGYADELKAAADAAATAAAAPAAGAAAPAAGAAAPAAGGDKKPAEKKPADKK